MYLIKENVKVELEYIGEGIYGDYNEVDPNDTQLLRFSVWVKDGEEWVEVEKASYCTQVIVETPEKIQKKIVQHIMDYVFINIRAGRSVKTICERLSWISSDEFDGSIKKE